MDEGSKQNPATKRTNGKSSRPATFGTNDPAWYKNYSTLAGDVASLVMSRPNGLDFPLRVMPNELAGSIVNTYLQNAASKQGGFLAVNVIPTFGGTSTDNQAADVINVAAGKLYYYIVHGNSRNISYDKSDLIRCIMGFDSLQCVIADAIRAYKFIKAVDPQNRWYKEIVSCLGWNADDLSKNIVRFRTAINLAIQRFNQISIPNVFKIFDAHKHIYDHVYADRAGAKAQYSAPVLTGFWFYNDEKATVDWISRFKWNGEYTDYTENRTVENFETAVNFLLHTLYDSTDMGVMQGDIRKAFGSSQMLTMYMLEDTMDVPLLYDTKEFLLKLHNMEFTHEIGEVGEYTLTTDNLTYYPKMTYRDSDLVDGNLMMLRTPGTSFATPTGLHEDNVHMMDLPDDLNADVDSVIQMQLFKAPLTKLINDVKFYHSDTEDQTFMMTGDLGPYMVTDASWYNDLRYTRDPQQRKESRLYMTRNMIWTLNSQLELSMGMAKLARLLTLQQFAVTIPLNVWVKLYGNNVAPLPYTWETENVTVYDERVLKNILKVCVESLFYASELYNAQSR